MDKKTAIKIAKDIIGHIAMPINFDGNAINWTDTDELDLLYEHIADKLILPAANKQD